MLLKLAKSYQNSFKGLAVQVWWLSLITLINRAGTMVIPFMSLYLTENLKFTLSNVGWIMTAFGLGSVCGAWLGGKLTNKFGFYKVMFWSLFVSGFMFIGLQFIQSFYGICIAIFFLMLGLSFAAVPLYELFCRVTGFAGTTQVAKNKEVPKIIIDQVYKLRFDTNVGNQLEWDFFPEKNTLELKPGEVHNVKFYVQNLSQSESSGVASYNASPSSFGIYLSKIGCFCFEKQTLKAGEEQEFNLTFFLDPKVVDDNKTKNISDVTLSFTFFASDYYEKSKI